jgi:hypothetical protein
MSRRKNFRFKAVMPKSRSYLADKTGASSRTIQATGMDCVEEAQGGKFYEFNKGSQQLCKLMGLKNFWQEDVMMCDHPDPADYIKNNSWRYAGWQRGWAARRELENLTARK